MINVLRGSLEVLNYSTNNKTPDKVPGMALWLDANLSSGADGSDANVFPARFGNNINRVQGQSTIRQFGKEKVIEWPTENSARYNTNQLNTVTIQHWFALVRLTGLRFAIPGFSGQHLLSNGSDSQHIRILNSNSWTPDGGLLSEFVTASTMRVNKVQTISYPFNEWQVISVPKTDGVSGVYNNLDIGRDLSVNQRWWVGEMSQIIGYTQSLSISEIQLVENYLTYIKNRITA